MERKQGAAMEAVMSEKVELYMSCFRVVLDPAIVGYKYKNEQQEGKIRMR